jgi:serine/threonine protein phosphatase PrpC
MTMPTCTARSAPAADRPMVSTAASHCGRVRANNQDAFLERPELGLWAVADGMGGLANGERASRAVVEALARLQPGADLAACIEASVARVNEDLHWEAATSESGKLMGSTAVVLLADGRRFTCLWVGDSRLYRWRQGALQRLTIDHTPIQDLLDAGLSPVGHAGYHRLDHVVNRAIGTDPVCKLDRINGTIEPGDIFLLCTDGLSRVIDEPMIGTLLAADPPPRAARHLIEAALLAGGPDNVTVVIVREPEPIENAADQATQRPVSRATTGRRSLPVPEPAAILTKQSAGRSVSSPATSRRPTAERVAWLGALLALLVGLLSIGLQKTELRLQFAAVDPASVADAPVLKNLSEIDGRVTMTALAEGFFLVAALAGFTARRQWLAYAGVAAIAVGLVAAVLGLTDLADPTVLTEHINLPTLPLPVSQFLHSIITDL